MVLRWLVPVGWYRLRRRLRRVWKRAAAVALGAAVAVLTFHALTVLVGPGGSGTGRTVPPTPTRTFTVTTLAPCQPSCAATVVSITDGDTFQSTAGPVRIDNVEAPDSEDRPRRCHNPQLAAAATAQLAALIPPGTAVQLDRTGTSYDRIVALVYLNGQDVGRLLLEQHPDLFDPYPHVGGPCPGATA